jgi:ParB-like chromosome segregation protein Spo0J
MTTNMQIEYILADEIYIPDTMREIDSDHVEFLVKSIKKVGIIQPLTVGLSDDGGYILRSGQHRLCAARKIGLVEVPVIILNSDDPVLIRITENMCRKNLTPAQEARELREAQKLLNLSVRRLAEVYGLKRSTVQNRLKDNHRSRREKTSESAKTETQPVSRLKDGSVRVRFRVETSVQTLDGIEKLMRDVYGQILAAAGIEDGSVKLEPQKFGGQHDK